MILDTSFDTTDVGRKVKTKLMSVLYCFKRGIEEVSSIDTFDDIRPYSKVRLQMLLQLVGCLHRICYTLSMKEAVVSRGSTCPSAAHTGLGSHSG